MIADDVADAVGENLRAAAGHGIHSGVFQPLQRFANRQLRALGKIRDLDHGEGLDMHLREALLEAAHQIEKIFERQIGMQAADDVKLGDRLGVSRGRAVSNASSSAMVYAPGLLSFGRKRTAGRPPRIRWSD